MLLHSKAIDVLGIGESWLTQDNADSFIAIDDYKIYRGDSHSNTRKHGSAIYIRDTIKHEEVPCDLENLTIIRLPDQDIYVLAIYRPPSYTFVENSSMINFLVSFCSDREVALLGDFNLPTQRWENDNPSEGYVSPNDLRFLNLFADTGVCQTVKEPTFFPSGIDIL